MKRLLSKMDVLCAIGAGALGGVLIWLIINR